jgi:fibronectin type 3 domain-containing protein
VTRDIFPPAVPRDLVAIADEGSKAIDLSWSADNEPDLAGYFVYRQNPVGAGREMAVRISGPRPLATPTFHDTDVKPGAIYAYTVSAVDQQGNESAQSPEADESLPPSQ